jgi:hypothetical protein
MTDLDPNVRKLEKLSHLHNHICADVRQRVATGEPLELLEEKLAEMQTQSDIVFEHARRENKNMGRRAAPKDRRKDILTIFAVIILLVAYHLTVGISLFTVVESDSAESERLKEPIACDKSQKHCATLAQCKKSVQKASRPCMVAAAKSSKMAKCFPLAECPSGCQEAIDCMYATACLEDDGDTSSKVSSADLATKMRCEDPSRDRDAPT